MASASLNADERLPVAGLLALAMAGFLTILTEALPAGLLPREFGKAGDPDRLQPLDHGWPDALYRQQSSTFRIGETRHQAGSGVGCAIDSY